MKLLSTYLKRNIPQAYIVLMVLFFIMFSQKGKAQFEFLKPLEELPMSSEKYNFSTLVEAEDAYYFIYRLGGPDLVYDTHRFQLVKTDLEGNTIFQKEIAAPENINFFWGYNSASPPPIAYRNGRLSVVVSAIAVTIDAPANNYLFQFIFDENGNLIQNTFFEVDLAQEFFEITSVEDGFLFATSPIYVDVPEAPTNLHVFKTDIDGNLIWEKAYQFTEGYNTIYLKDIIQTSNGDIYIAIFNYPLTGGLTYGEAIIKLDNDGEFLFAKRYYDPNLIGGNIYNMSLAFQSHNESDELYLMSSWTATIGIWRTNLFKLSDDGTLLETKRLDGVEYASKIIAPSGGGATVLLGKNGGDPIDGSFANWGDPILIRFNPVFDVDWAYAYGGEETHYTDDMIYTSDGRYLISARSSSDAYMIKTESNGASVCETKAVTVVLEEISFEEESPEVSSLDITYTIGESPVFIISDIPFYNSEEKCCPYGLPNIEFEYSFGTENGELIFNNTSSNADTYDWGFGDGNFSTTANASHQYETPGLYEVCLMASNECGSEEICEEILVEWSDVAIPEWEKDNVQVFSNDFGIHVHTNELSNVSVRLRNVLGQVLYEKQNIGANISLLLPQQKTGLYFCDVIYRGEVLKVEKLFVD